jgi:hypothetical protein
MSATKQLAKHSRAAALKDQILLLGLICGSSVGGTPDQ